MIDFILFVYLIFIICIFLYYIIKSKQKNNNKLREIENLNITDELDIKQLVYTPKEFMTKNELDFYNILKELELSNKYKVHPQINLASIIHKIDSKYRTELFRNIDFAIFSNNYTKLYLLIELNDNSHERNKRKYRDIKIKEICDEANIPLITFYTKYSNEKNYVINRILKEINKENN